MLLHYCPYKSVLSFCFGLHYYIAADEFPQFFLYPLNGNATHRASDAHCPQGHYYLWALDIDKLYVPVVGLQPRPYFPFDNILYKRNLLEIGKSLGSLGLLRERFQCPYVFKDRFDIRYASAAPASSFCVIGNLFNRGKMVFYYYFTDLLFGHLKALADDTLSRFRGRGFAPVVGNRGVERFLTHYRTVHLFFRQAAEKICYVLVGDIERLVESLAFHQFG